jgi:DeoR family suf operon transcriptional repressor
VQSTRERILNILKQRGQATVDELSQELALTAVTVRHHLDILRGEGLIAPPLTRRRKTPGRPQYAYALAEKASGFFPKRYDHLAQLILDEVRACLPSEEVEQMMKRIGERIASTAAFSPSASLEARLTTAVDFINNLGYMARWESDGDGYLLHIVNCPYEHVSLHDDEICSIDHTLLTHLLGVPPERTSWSAHGDSHCTYAIRSTDE